MEQSEDFAKLFNKVKGNMQRAGCTDELLKECEAHLIKDGEKSSMQPVFIALSNKDLNKP